MAPADSRAASATGINIMTCHLPSKCRLKQVSAELAEGPATPTLSVPKPIGYRGWHVREADLPRTYQLPLGLRDGLLTPISRT